MVGGGQGGRKYCDGQDTTLLSLMILNPKVQYFLGEVVSMSVGTDLATDIGLNLGTAKEIYNVGGMEFIHQATFQALKDALMFPGTPSYMDKYTHLNSDITIDEISIRTLNISRYMPILSADPSIIGATPPVEGYRLAGSDEKAKIANQLIDEEYKRGRYYPYKAEFISRPLTIGDKYRLLHISIDGYIPKTESGSSQFTFENKDANFEYEMLDENFIPLAYGDVNKGLIYDCIPPTKRHNIRYKIVFPVISKPPVLDSPILDSVMIVFLKNEPNFILSAEIAEVE